MKIIAGFKTYGKSPAHLKSDYTDILAVDHVSNGKTLNATFWLTSGFDNSSTSSIYNQPLRKITYGMLINVDSNTKTGYNGADYDFDVEAVAGNLSAYLYQLSSTGGYRLVGSKINFSQLFTDPNVLGGSVNLQMDLSSYYPSKYNVLFYTAESLKSDEVRQFTNWVMVPSQPTNNHITDSSNQNTACQSTSTSVNVGTNTNVISNSASGACNSDGPDTTTVCQRDCTFVFPNH